MRKIIYKCDACGREYPYELQAGQADRNILKEVVGKDFCYKCLKDLKILVDNLCNRQS